MRLHLAVDGVPKLTMTWPCSSSLATGQETRSAPTPVTARAWPARLALGALYRSAMAALLPRLDLGDSC
jgi:hypothetical protein